jgi:hypothetical protein
MDSAAPHTAAANSNVEPEADKAWRDHCLQMAPSTEALAHWCDDAGVMNAYLELARKWEAKAASPQTGSAAPR